jgi:monothiol glutaredoxin
VILAWPKCGFSRFTSQLLDYYGAEYKSVDVLEDEDLRQGIKEFSNWPTIPQVYVRKEFIGGSDIMKQLHESGELEKLLKPSNKSK